MPWQGTWLVASWLTGCAFDSDTVVGTTQSWVGANCCILPLPAHVALAHVALVYTVWTLTGVLNSLAHSVMSITTFPQLSFQIATECQAHSEDQICIVNGFIFTVRRIMSMMWM